jgi:hypothetical protein
MVCAKFFDIFYFQLSYKNHSHFISQSCLKVQIKGCYTLEFMDICPQACSG